MTAFLHYNDGRKDRSIVCKPVLTIGRDKASDIILPDLMVSRHHAMIRRIGNQDFYFIDGGSSNGSYVNKQRVTLPKILKDGDRINIGRIQILFEQPDKEDAFINSLSMQDTIVYEAPQIKQITVLVADIRGFTGITEQLPIKRLTAMMNHWFNNISDVVVSNGGMVDKFIGDCVFARWEDDNQQMTVLQALRTAILIQEITDKIGKNFKELTVSLRVGVGINTGTASTGVGHDNTALGDAVNIAFRLEEATKQARVDIMMSENAYRYLPEKLWQGMHKELMLKGKKEAVRVCGFTFRDIQRQLQNLN